MEFGWKNTVKTWADDYEKGALSTKSLGYWS